MACAHALEEFEAARVCARSLAHISGYQVACDVLDEQDLGWIHVLHGRTVYSNDVRRSTRSTCRYAAATVLMSCSPLHYHMCRKAQHVTGRQTM